MTTLLPMLGQRIFNTPLVLHPDKAEVVLAALSDRLGIAQIGRLDGAVFDPAVFAADDGQPFSQRGRNPRAGYDMIGPVAQIAVQGSLVKTLGSIRPYSGMTGYDGIRQNFVTALSDPAVEAIVFDIDSPGGEVAGLFDLADLIYEARGEKPIWAILNEVAYSGAYAIASAADRIVVPRTGGVGSIGVIVAHVDMSQSLTAKGIKVTFITYGENKANGSDMMPLSPDAKAAIQERIDTVGDMFVSTVARNRGVSVSSVRDTQAATFMGGKGVAIGLADEVAAPDAAFRALIKQLA